ncbi:MAG: glycosyltransferase family 1 protein [Bacteroidota bacterium]
MSSRLIVAIPKPVGTLWTGGVTYIQNLISAVNKYAYDKIEFIIYEPASSSKEETQNPALNYLSQNINLILPALSRKILGVDYKVQRDIDRLPEAPVDAVFNISCYVNKSIAKISWLPDFQQLHLPEMFSESEVKGRNAAFLDTAIRSDLVVLSSQDALNDYSRFAPDYISKARVLHFTASVPEGIYDIAPETVCRIYNLPEKFIYLPNQLWKHKNHLTVLEALSILKKRGKCNDVFLVCTGNMNDVRNPSFMSALFGKISELELRNRAAFLGMVPYEHVFSLIRQSAFVINPSLFEGWSTTVEETKSVGKSILLSDLNVHREQNPPNAMYFAPKSAEELSEKIEKMWNNLPPGPDLEMETKAKKSLPERQEDYALTFAKIVKEAVEKKKV